MGWRRGFQFRLQVLDGPPGVTTRRLSSFLLIPVGYHRQGFASVRRADAGHRGCRPRNMPTSQYAGLAYDELAIRWHRRSRRMAFELYGLQKTFIRVAADATVGQQIEVPVSRLDQKQPHPFATFDAGHLNGGLKARAGGGRSGAMQNRTSSLRDRRRNATLGPKSTCRMSDSRHN
jgi:hypothetical protein